MSSILAYVRRYLEHIFEADAAHDSSFFKSPLLLTLVLHDELPGNSRALHSLDVLPCWVILFALDALFRLPAASKDGPSIHSCILGVRSRQKAKS